MKLWIALGIAIVLGAFIYLNQPESSPASSQQVSASPVATAPKKISSTPPALVPKRHPVLPRAKSNAEAKEDPIHEENFVEAVEDDVQPEEQKAPDTLRYQTAQDESSPLLQLTNFEQNKNQNSMVTITYGSDPKMNFKIEDREVRRRRAFVASESDQ